MRSFFVLVFLPLISAAPLWAGEAFRLPEFNPFNELRSYTVLEQLAEYTVLEGDEGPDGRLWFATSMGLIAYDGIEIEEHPFEEPVEGLRVADMRVLEDGRIVMASSMGLTLWDQGEWISLLKNETGSSVGHRDWIAVNEDGEVLLIWYGSSFRLAGRSLKKVALAQSRVNSVVFDRSGDLWFTLVGKPSVYRKPGEGVWEAGRRWVEAFELESPNATGMQLEYDRINDALLAFNRLPDAPAYELNRESGVFEALDLTDLCGTNHHAGGLALQEGGFLLLSKSSMMLKREGKWSCAIGNDLPIPLASQVLLQREGGNIILSDVGDTPLEIDANGERWFSAPGVHFQCEDLRGRAWFIGVEGDVAWVDLETGRGTSFSDEVIDTPLTVFCDSVGVVWVAGRDEGIAAVSRFEKERWTMERLPELGGMVSHLSALEYQKGRLIFGNGTEIPDGSRTAAVVFERTDEGYRRENWHISGRTPRLASVATDSRGRLWAAGSGLIELTEPGVEIEWLERDAGAGWIDSLDTTRDGAVWVGSWRLGVRRFLEGQWTYFGENSQLGTRKVSAVLADQRRFDSVWVSTQEGISRFVDGQWIREVLPPEFGFGSTGGTLKQSTDGSLWINRANREWYFRTERSGGGGLGDSTFGSVRYRPDGNAPQFIAFECDEQVVLPAGLFASWQAVDQWSRTPSKKIEYSYRVNDGVWSQFSLRGDVLLKGLTRGDHQIEVRARDLDGNVTPQIATASFAVLPPVWMRWWFVLLMVLVVVVVIGLILQVIRMRVKHLVQVEDFKLQFFTNVSHELRTPLGLIVGPLERFLENPKAEKAAEGLQIAMRNGRKLLRLVDQILEFRRVEVGQPEIKLHHGDLVSTVRDTVVSAQTLAEEEDKQVFFFTNKENFLTWYDSEKLESAVSNLVFNAVKYVERRGEVTIKLQIRDELEEGNTECIVTVEDNGVGIPKERHIEIFQPFYRAPQENAKGVRGTGLGLALTYSMVKSLGGSIRVESPILIAKRKERGTRFTLTLPLGLSAGGVAENPDTVVRTEVKGGGEELIETVADTVIPITQDPEHVGKVRVLLVEDDADYRSFLRAELESEYEVITAEDGVVGWEKALASIPDLVVTDVMMDRRDGKELCRMLKEDEATCHIPVFMLTALKSSKHELEGLEKGADDYFAKPVNMPVFKKRIRNIVAARKLLHERYSLQVAQNRFESSEIAENPMDESFLDRVRSTVEENLGDPLFGVERLADMMNVGRMTLFRKCKALIGDTPGSFLRTCRMRRAAELLEAGVLNVSEIADEVGMQDVSYFSTSFKKHYGVSPSNYRERGGEGIGEAKVD